MLHLLVVVSPIQYFLKFSAFVPKSALLSVFTEKRFVKFASINTLQVYQTLKQLIKALNQIVYTKFRKHRCGRSSDAKIFHSESSSGKLDNGCFNFVKYKICRIPCIDL